MRKVGNPTGKNARLSLPSADVLRDRYAYDESTGKLTDRIGSKMRAVGAEVGFVSPQGYLRMDMAEGRFMVHRVIWKMVTGIEPPHTIDHRDTNRQNNRFGNLREADDHSNGGNAKPRTGCASPLKGVFLSHHGRWTSQIRVRNKRFHLGYFDTEEAAHAAYMAAAELHYGEFARAA